MRECSYMRVLYCNIVYIVLPARINVYIHLNASIHPYTHVIAYLYTVLHQQVKILVIQALNGGATY